MEFVAALMPGQLDRRAWLRRREAEGWFGVSLGDHVAPGGRPFPHLWVGLTEMAMATSSLQIVSAFANNLYRSPVEFAQAALTLQSVSNGRFEAGLGAGWSAHDSNVCGEPFPNNVERARRYREAATVVGDLLRTGRCSFRGEFYDIEIDDIGVPTDPPPPLVVAAGGPWVTDHLAPLADRVEVVPFAHVFRSGEADVSSWASGRPDDIRTAVERARTANPDAPISLGLFVAAGRNDRVRRSTQLFADGWARGLAGETHEVADTLLSYEALGVTRCTVCELTPDSLELLAPTLLQR